MLIGLLSDTHDNLPAVQRALDAFAERGVEALFHAGDFVAPFVLKVLLRAELPITGVFGNNDGARRSLSKLCDDLHQAPHTFRMAGRDIVLTHDPETLTPDLLAGKDVAICGHIHEPDVTGAGPLVVNPGEVGGWVTGRCTAAVLDLDRMEVELIELGEQETVTI